MAYIRAYNPLDDETENFGQVSAASTPTNVANQTSEQIAQTGPGTYNPAAQQGTGFSNLQRYLSTNRNANEDMSNRIANNQQSDAYAGNLTSQGQAATPLTQPQQATQHSMAPWNIQSFIGTSPMDAPAPKRFATGGFVDTDKVSDIDKYYSTLSQAGSRLPTLTQPTFQGPGQLLPERPLTGGGLGGLNFNSGGGSGVPGYTPPMNAAGGVEDSTGAGGPGGSDSSGAVADAISNPISKDEATVASAVLGMIGIPGFVTNTVIGLMNSGIDSNNQATANEIGLAEATQAAADNATAAAMGSAAAEASIGNAMGLGPGDTSAAESVGSSAADAPGGGIGGIGGVGDDGSAGVGEGGDGDGDYSQGGKVNGPGTATSDSIPARLSDGEYIIPARVVNALGKDFFDKLIGKK